MAYVYANLIKKGVKTINDVPENLRVEVEVILSAQKPIDYFIQKGSRNHGNDLCQFNRKRTKDIRSSTKYFKRTSKTNFN